MTTFELSEEIGRVSTLTLEQQQPFAMTVALLKSRRDLLIERYDWSVNQGEKKQQLQKQIFWAN